MAQRINPFAENSPLTYIETTTQAGLPQFKANVTISYVAADTEITITPSSLSANTATVYGIMVNSSNGVVKHIPVNVATPAAVTVDLSGVTGFNLTKPFSFTFLAYKTNTSVPLQFGREIDPLVDYSQAFNNL